MSRAMPQWTGSEGPCPPHCGVGLWLGLEVKLVKEKVAAVRLGAKAGAVSLGMQKRGKTCRHLSTGCLCSGSRLRLNPAAKLLAYRIGSPYINFSSHADSGSLGACSPAGRGTAEMGAQV